MSRTPIFLLGRYVLTTDPRISRWGGIWLVPRSAAPITQHHPPHVSSLPVTPHPPLPPPPAERKKKKSPPLPPPPLMPQAAVLSCASVRVALPCHTPLRQPPPPPGHPTKRNDLPAPSTPDLPNPSTHTHT